MFADTTLINGEDLVLAKRNIIGEEEVKEMTVPMLVDTGSVYMRINETIKEQLQLPVIEKRRPISERRGSGIRFGLAR